MAEAVSEIIGFTFERDRQNHSNSRAYYIRANTPEEAEGLFRNYADGLILADGVEVERITVNEEKASGHYFGEIRFSVRKIKRRIDADLEELYGEKYSEDRKSGTHERQFRVRSGSARGAYGRIDKYIRSSEPVSGRLHISTISVDEQPDGDGWYTATLSYNNPSTKTDSDRFSGIAPAYGERISVGKDSRSQERVFELRGYSSTSAACDALRAAYQRSSNDEITVEEDSGGAANLYVGRIRHSYEKEEEEENEDQSTMQFEISGSSQKMLCSRRTIASYAAKGKKAPNFGGLIGVTKDAVEGVDLDVAQSSFSETHHLPASMLTAAFIAFLNRAYGRVNNVPFRGFSAGEVRFLGASGSYKYGDRTVELTYRFAVSANEDNIYVGDIGPIRKPGWAHAWVRYEDEVDGEAKKLIKKPVAVYIEQVFDEMNFAALGVGT